MQEVMSHGVNVVLPLILCVLAGTGVALFCLPMAAGVAFAVIVLPLVPACRLREPRRRGGSAAQ